MKRTVKYIRITGGKDDGLNLKVRFPMEVDVDEVAKVEVDGERYKFDRIENETAFFVHDGFLS
jgi:hypothetical protein